MARPRLGVWKFASCDGCQLTLLDCEDELLEIAGQVEIAYFLEATRRPLRGTVDIALVEGSITTAADAERIQAVRRAAKVLVTIGACATAGGIQALRNSADVAEYRSVVYARPEYVSTLERSSAIAEHVPVDFELRGCPIDKGQLVSFLAAVLAGRKPSLPTHSVCVECKMRGTSCLLVSGGVPCLGPVTQAGCGGLCPAYGRGCFGCFGPMETPNTAALSGRLAELGTPPGDLVRLYRTFNVGAPAFRAESAALEEGR